MFCLNIVGCDIHLALVRLMEMSKQHDLNGNTNKGSKNKAKNANNFMIVGCCHLFGCFWIENISIGILIQDKNTCDPLGENIRDPGKLCYNNG